jgi:uncharacterized protein YciI
MPETSHGAWAVRAARANFAHSRRNGMLFVIIGHDGPNGAALRPTVRPRHLAYVRPVAESGKMLIGGPFTDGSGSLIIVDMESEAAALEFASNDPYARDGVFERVEVKPFRKVLPE